MIHGPFTIAAIATVLAAAGFIQGLTGFGFAIVGMALLPALTANWQTSFSLVALNSVLIPFVLLRRHRGGFSVRPALALTAGALVGTYIGFRVMDTHADGTWFIRLFGLSLIAFSLFDIYMNRNERSFTMPRSMAIPCGVFGGFFGGAFNIGGPPLVAYAYSQPWSKDQIIGTLQFVFLCGTGYRMWMMGFNGYFDAEIVRVVAWTTLPTIAGLLAGSHLLVRTDAARLRTGVFVLVGLLGIKYAIVAS